MFGVKSLFFSMASALILMIIFAIASGAATIIESKTSTELAWAYVYGASWFALVQVLLGINLAYNIFRYKLINVKKLPSLLFHVGFLVILIGAGITRYFGFEGNMHIRENTETNIVTTKGSYINFSAPVNENEISVSIPRGIENINKEGFNINLKLPDGNAQLKFVEYIPKAAYKFVDDANGKPVIDLVISDERDREEAYLLEGEEISVGNLSFLFNTMPKNNRDYVLFELKDGKFSITSNQTISKFSMVDSAKIDMEAGSVNDFTAMSLYTVNGINFAPQLVSASATRKLVSTQNGEFDALIAQLNYKGESKNMTLFYNLIEPARTNLGERQFIASWGPQQIKLPFSLFLKDFELKRFAGSNSPRGYASEVVVKDNAEEPSFDYRIYMNHVLDYDGYRFFQSSYDVDERGTVLSVNNDPGKIPTYIGYLLLGIGFLLNVLNPGSRFRKLAKLIDTEAAKKIAAFFIAIFFVFDVNEVSASDFLPQISAEHAQKLSKLLVQSPDGRTKPFDTLSKEVLNKVHRGDSVGSLNSNQAMLSMMVSPDFWRNEPLISLGFSKELKKDIGVDENAKYASFNDFFKVGKDGGSEYKLTKFAEVANRKHPGSRGTFDKDVIKIDERLNVFYMIFIGEIFKIFPKQDDPSNSWYSPASAMMYFAPEESNVGLGMMRDYFSAVDDARKTQDWSKADASL
ncbi:MAG: cytochrome c biogenesis protein ResB, partial [Campylobacter sp.]|nr:cytochrome c biogenesis protein ResB [Campylobacter sp.]